MTTITITDNEQRKIVEQSIDIEHHTITSVKVYPIILDEINLESIHNSQSNNKDRYLFPDLVYLVKVMLNWKLPI